MTEYRPEDIARMEILGEIHAELLRNMQAGELVSPALAARVYRGLRETDDPDQHAKAEEVRDMLHETAANGVQLAEETLELLSDDPWWQDES